MFTEKYLAYCASHIPGIKNVEADGESRNTNDTTVEQIVKFFKADIEGKTRLAVAKHVVQRLKEEIGKFRRH